MNKLLIISLFAALDSGCTTINFYKLQEPQEQTEVSKAIARSPGAMFGQPSFKASSPEKYEAETQKHIQDALAAKQAKPITLIE